LLRATFSSSLFVDLLSSVPEDGVVPFLIPTGSLLVVKELLNFLRVGPFSGPFNDVDKDASVLSK
jgi:hypothetical protein